MTARTRANYTYTPGSSLVGTILFKKSSFTRMTMAKHWDNLNRLERIRGHAFVPKTAETYSHDTDGNWLYDGRWDYVWDGENRLKNEKPFIQPRSGAANRGRIRL